ncbi:Beta-1,3-galactosyltransferase 5 [Amphibalanus amphitrite]|uniref:Hexosyltransferase n=1 Tax=Amphibalanus amphitrite TaxID=1232801 RepID=A0A6A4VI73_AMPAM|nr:Beta-1,3-galactosyltransferase 5 [Amphibalanus amphitrite]
MPTPRGWRRLLVALVSRCPHCLCAAAGGAMPTPRGWRRLLVALVGWRRLLVALVGAAGLALLLLSRQLRPPEVPLPAAAGAQSVLPYHDSFEYLLNGPVCGSSKQVRAVIVVHSDPRRPEVRQAIRDSLPAAELAQLGLKRAFMLAEASTMLREDEVTIAQSEIAKESALHGDVVQGNFHDSYHNLTYKHIMALDWAITFCPQARHIIKMDDDIVYNVYELVKVLHFVPSARYLGGNVFPAAAPYRGNSKWRVSRADWPRQYYPPYVSGTDGHYPPYVSGTDGHYPPYVSGTDGHYPPYVSGTDGHYPPYVTGTDGHYPPYVTGTDGHYPPCVTGTDGHYPPYVSGTDGHYPPYVSGTDGHYPPYVSGVDGHYPPYVSGTDGHYPPYVSGWLYIASQDVARALVMQSTVVSFFWIDDVYVTGILAEQLHITVRGLNRSVPSSAVHHRPRPQQVSTELSCPSPPVTSTGRYRAAAHHRPQPQQVGT